MSSALSNGIRCWGAHTQGSLLICSARSLRTSARTCSSAQKQTVNPFPYPSHRNPTPHQLFHLPHNATDADIKARYFDLVRLYHPDKVGASSSSDLAHARFQAITAAYDTLRGKQFSSNDTLGHGTAASPAPRYQSTAAYRAMKKKRQELYDSGPVDDSKKDKLILLGVIMTIVFVMVQTASIRRDVLSEAMSRHRHEPARQSQRSHEEDRLLLHDSKPSETS